MIQIELNPAFQVGQTVYGQGYNQTGSPKHFVEEHIITEIRTEITITKDGPKPEFSYRTNKKNDRCTWHSECCFSATREGILEKFLQYARDNYSDELIEYIKNK